MAYLTKKWDIQKPENELSIDKLSKELKISKIIAGLLVNRGISDVDEAKRFINPDILDMHNPFLLPDIERAVNRIRNAIKDKEKILIYGDRDVDGISSVAIMARFFEKLGLKCLYYIPSKEGYGVHKSIIDKYYQEGVDLIITVDCGVSNAEEVSYANGLGIDVIVTDHHEPPDKLPAAYAVVNPKRKTSKYPFREIAGATVTFKVCQAIQFSFGKNYDKEVVAFDIKTTGLSPISDEITEIGAIKIKNGVLGEKFETLVNPGKSIPKEITEITGIDDNMVSSAPGPEEALKKFSDFIGERTLVAHNTDFDMGFIKSKVKKYLKQEIENSVVNTLSLAKVHFPTISELGDLAGNFNIAGLKNLTQVRYHRALNDATATAYIYQRLMEMRDIKVSFFLEEYLDLITLGTIADIVPLIDENRILVKNGLSLLKESTKIGIQLIVKYALSRLKKEAPSTKDISWSVVPILNAAGRMGKAEMAAELLLTDDEAKANKLMQEIIQINEERRERLLRNTGAVMPLVDKQCDLEKDRILLIAIEGIEHGVTGIVASRLADKYYRPAIVLIIEGDMASGAARSIKSFDIRDALKECSEFLVKYGGHKGAAGLTMDTSKIDSFRDKIGEIGKERIKPEDLIPEITVDGQLNFSDITIQLVKELEMLEPHGEGNPYPVFALRNASLAQHQPVGQDGAHLRLSLKEGDSWLKAIGFRMGELEKELEGVTNVDVAFQLKINVWKDRESVDLVLEDVNVKK